MPIAVAEATLGLIERLRRDHAGVVKVRIGSAILSDDDDAPLIYAVTLESPLISEDTPVVEIVIDGREVKFKPWRDA